MENQLAGQHVLDSKYALNQLGRESKELNVSNQEIVRISNLCDVNALRKLNISFNKLQSLDGIDQLPQLRELFAYSCFIDDISNLSSVNKLEKLFLQNNKISAVGSTLSAMNKLSELRLDKNKILAIEKSLLACASLKILNLAHNSLSVCDGIRGLQFLTELNLSNNNIKSLTGLKGLPNLRELDLSYNQLKALDGIQYLSSLEILHVEHNHIVHLTIPPYNSGNTATAAAISGNKGMGAIKKGSVSSSASNTGGKLSSAGASTASALPDVEGPLISELYLSGNRIKSIKGLESFAKTLEILDLSFNQIATSDLNDLSSSFKQLSFLQEIRFYQNPCYSYSDGKLTSEFQQVKLLLMECCPSLAAIDDMAILQNKGEKRGPSSLSSDRSVMSMDSKEFHTWEKGTDGDGSESLLPKEQSMISSIADEEKDDGYAYSSSDSEYEEKKKKKQQQSKKKQPPTKPPKGSSSSGKIAVEGKEVDDEEEEEENDENDPEKVNERLGLKVPKLTLKSVLTEEQILEKENNFLILLTKTKETLENSVFKFEQMQKLLFGGENSQENKENVEKDDEEMSVTSPQPYDRKRNFRLRKDTKLSEKLINALEKVLEEKDPLPTFLEGEVKKVNKPLPVETENVNTKSSVLTDQSSQSFTDLKQEERSSYVKPPLPVASSGKDLLLMSPSVAKDEVQRKLQSQETVAVSPFLEKNSKLEGIANTEKEVKITIPSNSSPKIPVPSSGKFASKGTSHSKSGNTSTVLSTRSVDSLSSGKTLHGSKQQKSDFMITNSVFVKNSELLYQSPIHPFADEKQKVEEMDQNEDVDFLNVKFSKKQSKLSYLQWANHENQEDTANKDSNDAAYIEDEGKTPDEDAGPGVMNEDEEERLLKQYEAQLASVEEEEDFSIEQPSFNSEVVSEMYSKPHTIGFDSRYGIANDINALLLPSLSSKDSKDDLLAEISHNLLMSLTPRIDSDTTSLLSSRYALCD
jgi:Leucine-rich repeat (LRR) protein